MSNLAQEEADRFFNQQGHLASHPEDRFEDNQSSVHSLDNSDQQDATEKYPRADDGDDEDTLHNMTTTTTSTATYRLPSTLFDANTGPKGVIADAQSFNRAKKRSFRKTLASLTNNPFSTSSRSEKPPYLNKDNLSSDNSGSEQGESEDEEFMRQWRENRLRELTAGAMAGQRRHSPSKRIFGSFDEVDANGYLDAVEKVGRDVVVVVCIYDPESSASAAVEHSLYTLAEKHATTRFIRLHHEIAEMNDVGIPAILAYRAGEVFATLPGCRPEGLETTLRRNGVVG